MKSFDEARGADALSLAADKVENAMRNSSMWSDVRVVAERPMIRLHAQHKSSEIHCNIAFGIHGTGVTVHTSRLIQYLFDAYENCKNFAFDSISLLVLGNAVNICLSDRLQVDVWSFGWRTGSAQRQTSISTDI